MDYVITHPFVLLSLVAFSAVGFVALVAIGLYYVREPREVINDTLTAGRAALVESDHAPGAGGGLAPRRVVALYDFERDEAFRD